MTGNPHFTRHVEAALTEFDFATAHDDAGSAINALTFVGMAQRDLGDQPLAATTEAAALKARAADHPDLIARAAANLDLPATQRRGQDGLLDSLYARTGYQLLLDMGTWPEPPLSDFHLGEVDDELAEAVAAAPPEVPPGIPPSHTWWRPLTPGT